jgi:hypothetical protein
MDSPATPGGSRLVWSAAEDAILLKAVASNSGKNWKAVAAALPNRTRAQCAHRFQKVLNPTLKKGAWTNEEDLLLTDAVNKHGSGKWSRIAEAVPGRNGKQCRERWQNHLRGDVKKEAFTAEEDELIVRLRTEMGNRWAQIARFLPGRTENAVKNRWNAKLALDAKAAGFTSPPASALRGRAESFSGDSVYSQLTSGSTSGSISLSHPMFSGLLPGLSIFTGAQSPLSRQSSLLSVLSAVSSSTLASESAAGKAGKAGKAVAASVAASSKSKRARAAAEEEEDDDDDGEDEDEEDEDEDEGEDEVGVKEPEPEDAAERPPAAKKQLTHSSPLEALLGMAELAERQQQLQKQMQQAKEGAALGDDWKSRFDSLVSASKYSMGQFQKTQDPVEAARSTMPASTALSQLDWLASIAAATALTGGLPMNK